MLHKGRDRVRDFGGLYGKSRFFYVKALLPTSAINHRKMLSLLAALQVKAVVLDPRNEFDTERALTQDDVRRLVQVCQNNIRTYTHLSKL